MRLLLHLLHLFLIGWFLPFLLLVLRFLKVVAIIQSNPPQNLFHIVIKCMAVSLQTVNHQPKSFDAVSDLNFFGCM